MTGALVAVGAGLTGFAVQSMVADQPKHTVLRATGGSPLLANGPVVNVRDLGATGDGRTDDGDAIRRGLAMVNSAGGTLYFPAGMYYYRATGALRPAAGITLAGDPGSSTIAFDVLEAQGFVEFCSIDTDGVTVDGLVVRRVADFPTVLLSLGAVRGFALSRAALVGNQEMFPRAYCHGVKIADGGAASDIHITDSTVATTMYGLLQTNASTATVTGVTVERCTFTGNSNTDLEFNSPYGSITQVQITGCSFSNNDSPGFGVGLAHVTGAVVQGNTFDGYSLEAVHVEDYSENINVQNNDFTSCGLRDYAHVQIIGGSRGVRVVGNTFHAGMNTDKIYVVNALPGGTAPTVSGRRSSAPFDVTIQGNTFDCAANVVPVYFQGVQGGSITSNTITGSDLEAPGDAFRLIDDPGTSITENTINSRRY